MKKILLLLLISSAVKAQNNKLNNLDDDFGLSPFKLESSYDSVTSMIILDNFDCEDCGEIDSIIQVHRIKITSKELFVDRLIPVNRGEMYFINDKLYKIHISFVNINYQLKVVFEELLQRYGQETELQGSDKIWETSKTYLKALFPKSIETGVGTGDVTIYSKKLQEIYIARKKSIIEKRPADIVHRGNGTFVPDINSAVKILLSNSSISAFEKMLPAYSVTEPQITYSYNDATLKYDIFSSILYVYDFSIKGNTISLEVNTDKNKIIKKLEFRFSGDPFIRFSVQRNQNNLVINEPMTKIVSKLGLNKCTVYDNPQKIHLTEYTSYHFSVGKY